MKFFQTLLPGLVNNKELIVDLTTSQRKEEQKPEEKKKKETHTKQCMMKLLSPKSFLGKQKMSSLVPKKLHHKLLDLLVQNLQKKQKQFTDAGDIDVLISSQ